MLDTTYFYFEKSMCRATVEYLQKYFNSFDIVKLQEPGKMRL